MSEFSLDLDEDQLQTPEVGPRLRGERDPTRPPTSGTSARRPLADHRGGGQHRALLLRVHHHRVPGQERAAHAHRRRGARLGRRRHRPRDPGQHARPGRYRRQRHARAAHGVGPAVLRHPGEDPAGRLRRVRAGRRLGRVLAPHPGRLRRGQGRVGAERHQDVDHQRRHRRHPRRRGLRRSGARIPWPGQLHRAAQDAGPLPGPEVLRRWASAPRTPPRSSSTTAGCRDTACWAARTSSTSGWPGPAKASRVGRSGGHEDVRGLPSRRSAPRRSVSPAPPTSTRSTTPRSARRSAGPSSRTRPSPSSWPT